MRQRVVALEEAYWVSERRSCRTIGFCRTSHRYRSHRRDDRAVRLRIVEFAETRVRYGYRRVQVLLRREGWRFNHKRTYRIYCEEGLHLRRKRPRRHISGSRRMLRPEVEHPNFYLSMDFMLDKLFDGRRIRLLTIVDNHTRESLAIHIGQRIRGYKVVDVLERVIGIMGDPRRSGLIIAPNSSRRTSISGPIGIMSLWTFFGRVSRRTTLISSPLTVGSGRSA
jgi:putative transposase